MSLLKDYLFPIFLPKKIPLPSFLLSSFSFFLILLFPFLSSLCIQFLLFKKFYSSHLLLLFFSSSSLLFFFSFSSNEIRAEESIEGNVWNYLLWNPNWRGRKLFSSDSLITLFLFSPSLPPSLSFYFSSTSSLTSFFLLPLKVGK